MEIGCFILRIEFIIVVAGLLVIQHREFIDGPANLFFFPRDSNFLCNK